MSNQDYGNDDSHSTSALAKKPHTALSAYGSNKPATPKMRPKHTPLQPMLSQEAIPNPSHFHD